MTFCDLAEGHECDSHETAALRKYLMFLRWQRLMEVYFT